MIRARILPQEGLKAIACIAMVIDHLAVVLFPRAIWMRGIGRIALPIFAFLLVEGFEKTRDRKKYALRLLLFALISEFPFDLAASGGPNIKSQNVMITLFFGFLALWVLEEMKDVGGRCFGILLCFLIPSLLHSDYGGNGVLMVLLFAISPKTDNPLFTQVLGLIGISLLIGGIPMTVFGMQVPLEALSVFALLPISLYNGEKGSSSFLLKWGFYWFYPLHLLAIKCVQIFVSSR